MTPQHLQTIKHSASSVNQTTTPQITTSGNTVLIVSVGIHMDGGNSIPDIVFVALDGGALPFELIRNVAGSPNPTGLAVMRHAAYRLNTPAGTHDVLVIFTSQVGRVTVFVSEVGNLSGGRDGDTVMVFGHDNAVQTDPYPIDVTDDFNRANENPIAGNWACEVLGSPPLPAPWNLSELRDGMVWGLGDFSNPVRYRRSFGLDVAVQAKAYGVPWPGVFTRLQPGGGTAYFYMWPDRQTATLYRFVLGSDFVAKLTIDMTASPLVDGDTIRLETEGNGSSVTSRCYKNGVLIGTSVDTDPDRIITPGYVGIHTDGIHAAGLDDFAAGPLTPAVQPSDPLAYWYAALFAVSPNTIDVSAPFALALKDENPAHLCGAVSYVLVPHSTDLGAAWTLGDGSDGYIGMAFALQHQPDPTPPLPPGYVLVRFLRRTNLERRDADTNPLIYGLGRIGRLGYDQQSTIYNVDEIALFVEQQANDLAFLGLVELL